MRIKTNEIDIRRLSEAQAKHYRSLIAQREAVNAEIQRFAGYLSQEHDIQGDGWTLHHDRFERDAVSGAEENQSQGKAP